MLNEFLLTKIEEEDIGQIQFQQVNVLLIDNIWFQQDGATCNTAEATLNVLRPVFEDRIIISRPDVVDIVGLIFVKDKLETIDAIKDNICEAIGEIQLHTIDNVLKNWTDRVGYCMASRGSHLNEIIFHY